MQQLAPRPLWPACRPSSFCGTFGFKPTRERLLSGEADGTHPLLKHHHAITRSVRDSAWLFELTQDRSAQAKYPPLSAQQLSPQNRPLKIGLMLDNIQQHCLFLWKCHQHTYSTLVNSNKVTCQTNRPLKYLLPFIWFKLEIFLSILDKSIIKFVISVSQNKKIQYIVLVFNNI